MLFLLIIGSGDTNKVDQNLLILYCWNVIILSTLETLHIVDPLKGRLKRIFAKPHSLHIIAINTVHVVNEC